MNHSFCSLCTSLGQPFVRIWVANNLLHFSYTHAQDPLEHQAEAPAAQVPLGQLAEALGVEVPADAAVEAAEKAAEVEVCWLTMLHKTLHHAKCIQSHFWAFWLYFFLQKRFL